MSNQARQGGLGSQCEILKAILVVPVKPKSVQPIKNQVELPQQEIKVDGFGLKNYLESISTWKNRPSNLTITEMSNICSFNSPVYPVKIIDATNLLSWITKWINEGDHNSISLSNFILGKNMDRSFPHLPMGHNILNRNQAPPKFLNHPLPVTCIDITTTRSGELPSVSNHNDTVMNSANEGSNRKLPNNRKRAIQLSLTPKYEWKKVCKTSATASNCGDQDIPDEMEREAISCTSQTIRGVSEAISWTSQKLNNVGEAVPSQKSGSVSVTASASHPNNTTCNDASSTDFELTPPSQIMSDPGYNFNHSFSSDEVDYREMINMDIDFPTNGQANGQDSNYPETHTAAWENLEIQARKLYSSSPINACASKDNYNQTMMNSVQELLSACESPILFDDMRIHSHYISSDSSCDEKNDCDKWLVKDVSFQNIEKIVDGVKKSPTCGSPNSSQSDENYSYASQISGSINPQEASQNESQKVLHKIKFINTTKLFSLLRCIRRDMVQQNRKNLFEVEMYNVDTCGCPLMVQNFHHVSFVMHWLEVWANFADDNQTVCDVALQNLDDNHKNSATQFVNNNLKRTASKKLIQSKYYTLSEYLIYRNLTQRPGGIPPMGFHDIQSLVPYCLFELMND